MGLCRWLFRGGRMSQRRRVNVGAWRIRPEDRDVSRPVLAQRGAGFANIIGAEEEVALGEPTTFRCHLTDAEIEQFRAASNCRFVEQDQVDTEDSLGAATPAAVRAEEVVLPGLAVQSYLRCDFAGSEDWRGRDVLVAVLDGGTTSKIRESRKWTLKDRRNFTEVSPGPDEVTTHHGCYVTPNAVPLGGQLLEAIISDNDGSAYHSDSAAAMRWAADNGAKIINYSYSGSSGSETQRDAVRYLHARGVQLFASAGNDGQHTLGYPSALCREFGNVHSSIAFDHRIDQRADFSNYHEDGSGCAPGASVLSLDVECRVIRWSGTSASSPHMAYCCARGSTGGRFSPAEVARALDSSARNTAEPMREEGNGAYDLHAGLAKLGAFTAPEPTPEPLPAPTGVAAQIDPSTNDVLVSWDAVPGATSYTVHERNMYSQTTQDLQMKFNNLDGGKSYEFWVVASDGVRTSPESQHVIVTIESDKPEPEPTWTWWERLLRRWFC